MAEQTNISWCDSTFNPVVGCERISPACQQCYAASWANRTGQAELWNGQRRRTSEANWRMPLKWEREHHSFFAQHRRRRRVFCASLADVFDNAWDPQWRSDLFKLIEATPNLDWLLLTKRIGNVRSMCGGVSAWPNVWLGATIANQQEADRDIPKLLATRARVRFLSCEPLLGAIDLTSFADPTWRERQAADPNWPPIRINALTGHVAGPDEYLGSRIDWVIAGGESGSKARPSHPDWFRSLRDQCVAAGVAFHFKQWGNWIPVNGHVHGAKIGERFIHPDGVHIARTPDKSHRTLDGKVWDQFPESA